MVADKYNQSEFLLLKVAYLYYIEDKSQSEIASELKVSITTVSRLLKKAKEEKIVEFVIRDPYIDCIRMEKELKDTFGLKDVIIAPGVSGDNVGNSAIAKENATNLVALEGARYLQRIIKKNDILGVTWGNTVYHIINYLNPAQRVDAKFVTLHGSIACCENELDVRTLVSRMAKAFSGEKYYLLTEALMSDTRVTDIVKNERNNKEVFEMFNHVDVSVVGVGSFYPNQESVLAGPDFMDASDLKKLKNAGVVGDIALRFFDKDGKECKTDLAERMIAISIEQYKKIPTKIAVAAGTSKTNCLYSALKGDLIDVLIIDSQLALSLLKLKDNEK